MASRVEGLGRLRKKLQAMPDAARAQIVQAMEQSAEEVCEMARRLAPVDKGDLRKSIGWTWGDPPKGAIVIARTRPKKNESDLRLTIYAGDDEAFYARWVEFGTKPHNVAKGGGNKSFKGEAREHPGARAHPFFFPAYRVNRKKAKSRVSRAINKAAKEVAGIT